MASPSYICNVTNVRKSSTHSPAHSLLLYLFLEDFSHSDNTQLSENIRWRQGMELVHKLRGGFPDFIMSQSKKFQQSIHSALNKIACNYSSHSKVPTSLHTHSGCVCTVLLTDTVYNEVISAPVGRCSGQYCYTQQ